jgi:phosphoribosylformylglycinamidine cyclo-ligase
VSEDRTFTYRDAGVDVQAGNEAVRLLRERLRSTKHPLVLEGIGGFGGVMRMPPIKDAVLVAGTDGVGTKIMLARQAGRLGQIGIDLVAMSVNDVSACGAVPLFFLDYLVVGKVVPEEVAEIVAGIDEGCLRAQCVLLGGETAEHPGQFADGDFDLAGFAVGVAERGELWGPTKVAAGDVVVGLLSSGLHANGFSLVRKLLTEHAIDIHSKFVSEGGAFCMIAGPNASVADVLLQPTIVYSPVLHDLGHAGGVHAAAHITGGGFPDNLRRALPDGLAVSLDLSAWEPPAVYEWIHALGVTRPEMLGTFNCGIGMAVILAPDAAAKALDVVARGSQEARVIGEVVPRAEGDAVRYRGELAL